MERRKCPKPFIVAPRFIWGIKKRLLPKRLPSTLSPATKGAGESVEFACYNTIYILLDPTPKGVDYDLDVHFTYLHDPKFIAP